MEGDEYGEEVRAEEVKLQEESQATRTRYESALLAEGDEAHLAGERFGAGGSAEDRAYRELCGKADVGAIFAAAVEKRATAGAEAEIQQFHKLNANQVPLDLLRGPVEEHRAVTAAPGNVGTSQEPVLLPVFAAAMRRSSGSISRAYPAGDAVFPVLETRPTIRGPFTDSSDARRDRWHDRGQSPGAWAATGIVPVLEDRCGSLRFDG